jgi:two-component system, cell cycle sensor histidine kinase and response regulator CckA
LPEEPDMSILFYSVAGICIVLGLTLALFFLQMKKNDRKKAVEALRISENRYRSLFENSRDAIGITVLDGTILDVNQAWLDLFGYTREEVVGQPVLLAYIRPEDRLVYLKEIENKGYVKDYEIQYVKKDGSIIDCLISTSVYYDERGNLIGNQSITRDITHKKIAERLLRESEERHQALFESIDNGVVIYRAANGGDDFIIVEFNKAAEVIENISRYSVLGKSVLEVFPGIKEFGLFDVIQRVWKTGKSENHPISLYRDNRILGWRDNYVYKLPSGEVVAVYKDVTHSKRVEEALRDSEKKYRTLFNSAQDMIFIHDLEGRFLEVNQTACDCLGYSREEFAQMSLEDIAAPEYAVLIQDRIKKLKESGHLVFESIDLTRDKVSIPVEVNATIIEYSGKPALLSIARDITKRKKTEESLLQYQYAIETSMDIISAIDHQYRYIFTNETFLRYRGLKREQVVGHTIPEVIGEEFFFESIKPNLDRSLNGEIVRFEISREFPNMGIRFLSMIYYPIRDEHDLIRGIVAFSRDITDSRHLEAQYLQSQKMESIARLAGGVAHDFNNLLTAIIGYADLAVMEIPETAPYYHDIIEIKKTADRAAALTRQLLAFSRRQIIEMKNMDLNDIIISMDKMIRRLIGEDIELVTIINHDIWTVRVDPGQMEQVLVNLVVNARDAMPRGGRLTLETANVILGEEYIIRHAQIVPGKYVMMAVSDTGSGMSEETKSHAFEPFFTTKGVGKGTGLGLSTCYGIVKQSGGYIWLYSELDHGTTIKIYLPRVDENAGKFLTEETFEALQGGNDTILLVEDEPTVRAFTKRILTEAGYHVHEASDGREALKVAELLGNEQIHLLLTDVVMPHMGGKELSKKLLELRPDIQVLFISGYTINSIVHDSVLDAGIEFVQKPFTSEALLRKIRKILKK